MYEYLESGDYPMIPLAPDGGQKYQLFQCLNAARWVYNTALSRRKEFANNGLRLFSSEQAKELTVLRQREPRLQVIPYDTVEAILRGLDIYAMNLHSLPAFAKSEEWNVIPYKKGVVPCEGGVWIPKVGEVGCDLPSAPFRSSWVVKTRKGWALRTKPKTDNPFIN